MINYLTTLPTCKALLTTLVLTMLSLIAMPSYAKSVSLEGPVITVEGQVTGSVLYTANTLLKKAEGQKRVNLLINSPGGSVYAGMQFINAMRIVQSRGTEIYCYVTVMAASMAFQIFAECDRRFAFEYSLLLWHPPRLSGCGCITLLPNKLRAMAAELGILERTMVKVLREKLNLSKTYFYRHYHRETLHIAANLHKADKAFVEIVDDVKGLIAIRSVEVSKKDKKSSGSRTYRPGPFQPWYELGVPDQSLCEGSK